MRSLLVVMALGWTVGCASPPPPVVVAPPPPSAEATAVSIRIPGQQGPQSTLSSAAVESVVAAKPAGGSGGAMRWIGLAAGLVLLGGVAAVLLAGGDRLGVDGVVRTPAKVVTPAAPAQPAAGPAGKATFEDERDAGVADEPAAKAASPAAKVKKANKPKPKARPKPKPKAKRKRKTAKPDKDDALKIDLDL